MLQLDAAFLSGKTRGDRGQARRHDQERDGASDSRGRWPTDGPPHGHHRDLIVGADQPLLADWKQDVDSDVAQAIETGAIEVLQETELWQRLGVSESQPIKQLYTPAMLADLLHVSVRVVRRWHRMG